MGLFHMNPLHIFCYLAQVTLYFFSSLISENWLGLLKVRLLNSSTYHMGVNDHMGWQ